MTPAQIDMNGEIEQNKNVGKEIMTKTVPIAWAILRDIEQMCKDCTQLTTGASAKLSNEERRTANVLLAEAHDRIERIWRMCQNATDQFSHDETADMTGTENA